MEESEGHPGRRSHLEGWAPIPLPLPAVHSARPGVLRPGLVPAGSEQAPPWAQARYCSVYASITCSTSQAVAPEGGWQLTNPTSLGAAYAGTASTPRACPWGNRWPHSQSESLSPYTDGDPGTLSSAGIQSLAPKTAGSVS